MAQAVASVFIPDELEYNTEHFLVPQCYAGDLRSVVITEGMIRDRIKRLAHDIHEKIGDQPIAFICVLKGSYRFFTALVDEISFVRNECKTQISIDFIRAVSYSDGESTGQVRLVGLDSLSDLSGLNVLIVDDIVDSGLTVSRIVQTIECYQAKRVWTSFLLSKRVERKASVREDFVAFNIPDKFVVGFGLDYNQRFRDLSHICSMSDAGISKYKKKS